MPDKRSSQSRKQRKDDKKRFHASGPRPFWSGTITFGLVSLPVNLYPANRSKPVSLRMVDKHGTPLARRYFCQKEQRILESHELIRGYEVEKNEFVVVEDRELEELAPEKSQEIDLKRFVALDEIDPMYFQRAYFLTPDKGVTKAYRLLAKTMEESQRAGIATFVMRGKEYLVAIIAEKGILRAETLRFADEIRSPEDVGLDHEASAGKPDSKRIKPFEQAIESLSTDTLERELLEDRHSQDVLARVREKLANDEDVIAGQGEPAPEEESGGEVVDLMQVLKQSLSRGAPPQRDVERKPGGKNPNKRQGKKKGTKEKASPPPSQALAKLSKQQLYQRAQEKDIAGRSNMNKPQLIEAIQASEK